MVPMSSHELLLQVQSVGRFEKRLQQKHRLRKVHRRCVDIFKESVPAGDPHRIQCKILRKDGRMFRAGCPAPPQCLRHGSREDQSVKITALRQLGDVVEVLHPAVGSSERDHRIEFFGNHRLQRIHERTGAGSSSKTGYSICLGCGDTTS